MKRPRTGDDEECVASDGQCVPQSNSTVAANRDLLAVEMKPDSLSDVLFLDQTKRKLVTSKIGESPLLSKLSSFLPNMEKANAELEERVKDEEGAKAVNIEHVEGGSRHIRMDIAVGVTDATTERRESAPEFEYTAPSDEEDGEGEGEGEDDDGEGEDDEEEDEAEGGGEEEGDDDVEG